MSAKIDPKLADLLEKTRSEEDPSKPPAWQNAGPLGAGAVQPLLALCSDPSFEVARKAGRALRTIVHYAGRPGATKEAKAMEKELARGLGSAPARVRCQAVWMLSELPVGAAVGAIASMLNDPECREDARCALTRIPGSAATSALRRALAKAPPAFQEALAESLRARGETVANIPSRKLAPSAPTAVERATKEFGQP